MKIKSKQWLFPAFILVVAFLVFTYDKVTKDRIIDKYNAEYPILSFKQEVHGVITNLDKFDLSSFRNDRNHVCLTIDDSLNIMIFSCYESLNDTLTLEDVLTFGDVLIKKSNCDTVFVSKGNHYDAVKYSFVLTDNLGYSLRK